MVSVVLFLDGVPTTYSLWTQRERKIARRAARESLAGVGIPETDTTEEGRIAYIVRRQCRDEERKLVTEKYLSFANKGPRS